MDELNANLKELLHNYLGLIFKIGLAAVILTTFFLFTNLTTEIYDTPKFLALLIFTAVMLLLLMVKSTIDGKVVLSRTVLDIPLLLLLAVGIVSTVLSPSPYVSLLGNGLKINGSLISLIAYVLFYFVLVNSLKGAKEVKWIFNLAIFLGQILAVVTILSYFGLKLLPNPWIQGVNFTPIGSAFSATAVLALLLPFIVIRILTSSQPLFIILNSLFLALSGLTIALTGSSATWTAALVGLGLTFFLSNLRNLSNLGNLRNLSNLNNLGLIVPMIVTAVVFAASLIPSTDSLANPVYQTAQNFPREVQLDLTSSWKIAVSAFRDTPFWGSGPATFAFDFTNYKPVEHNSAKFWNLRFDTAFNEYLQILATLGAVGLVAILSATALFISGAYKTYRTYLSDRPDSNKVPLAISGLLFFLILALHPATLPVWIIGILILASFMASAPSASLGNLSREPGSDFKSTVLRVAANITASSDQEIKVDALPGILLMMVLALVLFTGYTGGKLVLGDYHHRLALNAVAQNQGVIAYNELVAAEKLNPYSDSYRTDLAQTNFALANAIAASKGPTEASPAGSLTDADKQNIGVLLQQSINEGRNAVALSPKSAQNWEILALLYRQIAGVAQNALVFSLDSYGRAIFQDPLNPLLRLNVGGVYYAVRSYDMAIRFFTDSINLKPDFANGYYNLSVALRDKGDLGSAQAAAEKLVTLLDKDSQDYNIANDYLSDLKNKINSPKEPPAASASGALQEKALPKVVDVGQPPAKVATPAAIKKPAATPSPSPTANP